jgi:hypothetical protein
LKRDEIFGFKWGVTYIHLSLGRYI